MGQPRKIPKWAIENVHMHQFIVVWVSIQTETFPTAQEEVRNGAAWKLAASLSFPFIISISQPGEF
jgi:hypothetical protein